MDTCPLAGDHAVQGCCITTWLEARRILQADKVNNSKAHLASLYIVLSKALLGGITLRTDISVWQLIEVRPADRKLM